MEDNQVPDDQVIAAHQAISGISFHARRKISERHGGGGRRPQGDRRPARREVLPASTIKFAVQDDRAAERRASPTRPSLRQRRLPKDCTALPALRIAAWKPTAWPSEWASRQRHDGTHLDAEPLRHRGADGRAAGHSGRQHSACCSRYIGGGFGSKFAADRWDIAGGAAVEVGRRQAGEDHAGRASEEFEVAGMRPSAFARVKIAADKRRQAGGVGVALLGHRRNGRRRDASAAVHLRDPQSAQAEHCDRHQPGQRSRLARAESSAGRAHHHGGVRRPGGEAEHGSAGNASRATSTSPARAPRPIARSCRSPPS